MSKSETIQKQVYENHLHPTEARWFAVHTRSKSEKVVQKQLTSKNVTVFLPLQKLVRKWDRKVRHVELPLISCYVFVKIVKSEYIKVLETDNVAGFVRFSKNLLSIPDKEIEIVKRIVAEDIKVEVTPTALKKGEIVEIAWGRLTGIKGKLVAIEGKHSVLVDLENIGYSLQISIDPAWLQKPSGTNK